MIEGMYPIFNKWFEQGAAWLYSDPHFEDEELDTVLPNRPSATEQVRRINAKCGRNDTLIILGDVGDTSYISQLRAKHKILIMGNHDAGASNYKRQIWKLKYDKTHWQKHEALEDMTRLHPNCVYTLEEQYDYFHTPFEYWLVSADNRLFDEIYTGPVTIGEKIILSHEPIPHIDWAMNIHGHDHCNIATDPYHFNVCADVIGYEPINFNQWMKQGRLAKIQSLHRDTINKATEKAHKRHKK